MQNAYSLAKYFLYPEVWLFIGLCLGCLISWITRCSRSVRLILCLLAVLYYGLTTRPLAQALVQPLEAHYGLPATVSAQSDAIVLFVNDAPRLDALTGRPTILGTGNVHLLICGLSYVRARSAPIVVLGEGIPSLSSSDVSGTTVLQQWAVSLGYPSEKIITPIQGIATHERAQAMKQLLGYGSRILLIDTAIHLPRSSAAFRKAGFIVTPIPCAAYNISTAPWSVSAFVPHAENVVASKEAIYEYVGLLTYWMRGLI